MKWLARQSFLGANSNKVLDSLKVGFVGLGGGGSHLVQQAAHVGVGHAIGVDPDIITSTNLNRLVGGTHADVKRRTPKVAISERVFLNVNPGATFVKRQAHWQEAAELLKTCDVIFGSVDKVRHKDELEAFCRRFLIPYIDQGMDVHELATNEYLIAGQVVLSNPGTPCLRCLGVVTEEALELEGRNYGSAGGNPQVIWPNGILASTAIGLFMQLVTSWHRHPVDGAYLEYDGNRNTIIESDKFRRLSGRPCPHYSDLDVGDPAFDIRKYKN